LTLLAYLPWLILQPSVASTMFFYEFLLEPLALLHNDFFVKTFFGSSHWGKRILEQSHTHSLNRNRHCLSRWKLRLQLIVVSSLFGGNPFVDGVLGHNLLLSRAFSVGTPSWMGFLATTYCCLRPFQWEPLRGWGFRPQLIVVSGPFSQPCLAITKPFSWTFSFFTTLSGYHEAFLINFFFFHDGILAITKPFSRNFSFFTMEFWLSRSLSHELFLFSRWNSGYHEAFLTKFFFFHNGILAITKPFSWTFSFFTMEFWLSRSLSHELFIFSRWNSRNTQFGGSLFLYICHKEYLHRIRLVKNLALDLEPPLQGKEYGPPYSNATKKVKAILHLARTYFFLKSLIDTWFGFFDF
jgi:hypothetical protein